MIPISRREFLRHGVLAAGVVALSGPLRARRAPDDAARLARWVEAVRAAGLAAADVPLGRAVVGMGERAIGTPYVAHTLEQYLLQGGDPMRTEPLTLSLSRFDCVSLVESCIAAARVADRAGTATWDAFGREVERVRYRGGERRGYPSRLHYFSDWIRDNARRGGVRSLGRELGGVADTRPLRFMTEHRASYAALANPEVFREIRAMEHDLDGEARWVIPTPRIAEVQDRIRTGDVLAFATEIPGLDVTHSALAYRDGAGVLRVLHAPLSGGAVEISRTTLPEYVAGIRRSTGILLARPLRV